MKRKHFIASFAILLSILLASLVSCATSPDKKAETEDQDQRSIFTLGGGVDQAKKMLYLDDFQQFQKSEMHFVALRLKHRDDTKIQGLLTQIYVAWSEQLKSEIEFLKWRLGSPESPGDEKFRKTIMVLIDYKQNLAAGVDERARKLGDELITMNPDTYVGHRAMADYYRIIGDRKKMTLELAEVRKLNPKSNGMIFIEGAAKAQFDKDYDGAIATFDRAITNDPKFVKAIFQKGLALHNSRRYDEAKTVMKEVLEKSPAHPGALALVATDKYVKSLTKVAEKGLASTAIEQPTRLVRLTSWAASRVDGKPKLVYQVSGLKESDVEVKVLFSIVTKSGGTLGMSEQKHLIAANSDVNGELILQQPLDQRDASLEMIIQLSMKNAGEEDFNTIDVKKVPLPAQ